MARVDRTERLLNVVFCLLGSPRPVPRSEIRRAVAGYSGDASEVAFERMFERDKDALRSMGIPVETVLDASGDVEGYVIRRQLTNEELTFDADELAVIALAAATWQAAVLEAPAITALRKIESISGDAPELREFNDVRMTATDAALLPLMAALRAQRVVTFDYRGRQDDQAVLRSLDPWGVIAHDGQWYLVGHDLDRDERRTFRVSRISGSVTLTARPIEHGRPNGIDLAEIVRGAEAENPARARVLIKAGQGAQLRAANDFSGDPFQDVELLVTAISEDVLISQLCAAGAGVAVLEPPDVRTKVMQALMTVVESHAGANA
ncbi:MAG: WYL domain-containing protein [Actinomycetota bacterium]|nr:WYL domain-containing protein [Actinomycetota bacterium]